MNMNQDSLPRRLSAGYGWRWIADAYHLIRPQLFTWVLLVLASMVINILIGLVPMVGNLAGALLGPVFSGGLLWAAQKADQGGEVEIGDLFEGFRRAFLPLALLGVLYLAVMTAVVLVAMALGMGIGLSSWLLHGQLQPQVSMPLTAISTTQGLSLMLLLLVAGFIVGMCYWQGAVLVMLEGRRPVDALVASFKAGLANWKPLLVFSLAMLGLAIVAAIPLGLGFLLLLPVMHVSIYVAWKDVFGEAGPVQQYLAE